MPRAGSHPDRLLWALALVLALCATRRLADGFSRLIWLPTAPIDLEMRWHEVQNWFAGKPVYGERLAVYPPARYPILWPMLGWIDLASARRLRGATKLGMLGWLSGLMARGGARGRAQRDR